MPRQPELTLVRHGETEWSASGRHTSFTDVALTATGRAQAESLAGSLAGQEFDRVLTSPRQRARDTCALAGFGDRAEITDDLCEWDYGDFEGLTTAQIRESVPGWTIFTAPTPGGEAAFDVEQRADRIVAAARSCPGATLCFGHGHFLRVIAARWLGLGAVDASRFFLDTAGIGVLATDRGTPVMTAWNLH